MKATVTNVKSLLRSLHIDATSYFSIEKGDAAGVVVLTLVSSFLYRHDADRIETSLEDNFSCTFRRDKKGNLHMIALTSKDEANNTSQIEESKTELTANNTSQNIETKKYDALNPKDIVKILNEAKRGYKLDNFKGMCSAIKFYLGYALSKPSLTYDDIQKYIPEFNFELAKKKFNANQIEDDKYDYWWPTWDVKPRVDYFVYLIDLYEARAKEVEAKVIVSREELLKTYNNAREIYAQNCNYTGNHMLSDKTYLSDYIYKINTIGKHLGMQVIADIYSTKNKKKIALNIIIEAKAQIESGIHIDTESALLSAYQKHVDNSPEYDFHLQIDYIDVLNLIPEATKQYAIKAIDKKEGTGFKYWWWVGEDKIKNHIKFLDYLIELYK